MTGKERVLAAVSMRPTDRQPRDFHACGAVLDRLYGHFGVHTYKDLLGHLHSDIVDIRGIVDPKWAAPFPKMVHRADGSTVDYLGFCKNVKQTVFGPVEEHSDYLLHDCDSLEEIQKFRFPKVEWFDFSKMSGQLKEYEGLAIMASGASVYQHPTLVRGLEVFLCDLIAEPDIANFIIDAYVDFYCDYFKAMFEACPGQIDILRIADDFGMQDRALISIDLFETYFIPRIRRLCNLAHAYGVKVMFHSCGAVFQYIDLLIRAGVDILDPLQPNAAGMDPEHLRDSFEGKICFHGSIDTQVVLPTGTPEEVRAQVRKHISILGGAGIMHGENSGRNTGFIIAPAHTLQPDVRTENILAMYDEIDKLSGL